MYLVKYDKNMYAMSTYNVNVFDLLVIYKLQA